MNTRLAGPGRFSAGVASLVAGVSVVLLALLPSSLDGQANAREGVRWETHELAPGVYASIVAPPAHPSSYASSLIVVQDDHVVLVDTRESPRAARDLLADIRAITDKPVTTVINTHWHADHVYGNQVFAEAYPGVRILGHANTRLKLVDEGQSLLDEQLASERSNIERWERWAAQGETDDGRTVGPGDAEQLAGAIARARQNIADLEEVVVTAPTDTVPAQQILRGAHEVRVIHPGAAHTTGDLVVYLPGLRLLMAGDLIEQGFPYFGHGTVVGSAWALDRLERLEVKRILPSHARLQDGTELLESQRSFLRGLVDASRRDADVAAAVEPYREDFTQGDAAQDARFDQFVADLAQRASVEGDTLRTIAGACGAPPFRAFDFWIGTWEVTGPGGAVVGHNRIESSHGGCVLRENWTGATGNVGQSFNSYDRTRQVWHQTWVDNVGTLLLLDGQPIDNGMRLGGETRNADGSVTLHRITWTVEATDGSKIRQLWESSTDGGETWVVAFDGLYNKTGP